MPTLYQQDWEYLAGEWFGGKGAAWNAVSEFCRKNGLGGFGEPTAKGCRLMREYEDVYLGK